MVITHIRSQITHSVGIIHRQLTFEDIAERTICKSQRRCPSRDGKNADAVREVLWRRIQKDNKHCLEAKGWTFPWGLCCGSETRLVWSRYWVCAGMEIVEEVFGDIVIWIIQTRGQTMTYCIYCIVGWLLGTRSWPLITTGGLQKSRGLSKSDILITEDHRTVSFGDCWLW